MTRWRLSAGAALPARPTSTILDRATVDRLDRENPTVQPGRLLEQEREDLGARATRHRNGHVMTGLPEGIAPDRLDSCLELNRKICG